MKTIETILIEEKNNIEQIVRDAKKRLQSAPQGKLRVDRKRGGFEYYYKNSDVPRENGRYLRKSEINLAQRLAQRDYDARLVKRGEKRAKAIGDFLNDYGKTSLASMYENVSPLRKALIHSPIISDAEYIRQWQSVEYEGKPFSEDTPEYNTEKGERVRSKSEKIIGDKLFLLGLPYLYEKPLVLAGNIVIYPDFTILKMPERKEVYLEHLGRMDVPDYVEKVIYKLKTYEKNGIYLGVNLFITFETSSSPLNTRAMDDMLRAVFCVDDVSELK